MFRKDFTKLREASAALVTEESTYEILLRPRYLEGLRGVTIVELLSQGHAA